MKEVNMTIGRFQPFTNGHLQMCKDGYDKNGLPTVVLMITNKRPDQRHPFSDDLVKREIDIVKKNSPFIEDVLMVSNADIVKAGQILKENGYVAQMWLCGEDREGPYRKQAENPKYREQGGYPDSFTVYTGNGRTEGVSGTAVREAIKAGDKNEFKRLMPKGTDRLFGEFREQMSRIEESNGIVHLSDFIMESLVNEFKAKRYSGSNDLDTLDMDWMNQYLDDHMFDNLSSDISDFTPKNVREFLIGMDGWCYAINSEPKPRVIIDYWVSVGSSHIYCFSYNRETGVMLSAFSWFYDERLGMITRQDTIQDSVISEFLKVTE